MTYKLIVSLGGNCAVAHNLRLRNLRPYSLPFDWVYLVDDQPIRFWIDEISCGFSNLLRKKNMIEMRPGDKEYASAHADVKQYIDKASGYRFVNHFKQSVEVSGVYEKVSASIRKRVNRLINSFSQGGDFLLVLATRVDVPIELLQKLVKVLSVQFPRGHFTVRYMHFEQQLDNIEECEGVIVQNIRRSINKYDAIKTNWEWHFLDDLKVSECDNPLVLQKSRNRRIIKTFLMVASLFLPKREWRHKVRSLYC